METILLDVILQTHVGPNIHPGKRFVPFGKDELILGCMQSLVNSLERLPKNVDIRMVVADDHSPDSFVDRMKAILSKCKFPWQILTLPEKGNRASLSFVYNYARDHGRDLIYFTQDDYLHDINALPLMINSYQQFQNSLGREATVTIFPVDYPDLYVPGIISPSRIVLSGDRHWRTVEYTTGNFIVSKRMLLRYWYNFMAFSLYGLLPEIFEGSTLNKIWKEDGNFMFSPIPTLAIHMQFTENIPPFINWKEWWDKYSHA